MGIEQVALRVRSCGKVEGKSGADQGTAGLGVGVGREHPSLMTLVAQSVHEVFEIELYVGVPETEQLLHGRVWGGAREAYLYCGRDDRRRRRLMGLQTGQGGGLRAGDERYCDKKDSGAQAVEVRSHVPRVPALKRFPDIHNDVNIGRGQSPKRVRYAKGN